ncbi:MAG: ribonuclease P protein component [Patescibacteria group bacterium]
MLKQENRIALNKDFDRAFKAGQSFYSKIIGIKVVNNETTKNRVGILINTKVSKKAVVRNKIRRQIREIIKQKLDILEKGKDLVIIVFPLILDKNFQEIKIAVESGLKQLKVLKIVKK